VVFLRGVLTEHPGTCNYFNLLTSLLGFLLAKVPVFM